MREPTTMILGVKRTKNKAAGAIDFNEAEAGEIRCNHKSFNLNRMKEKLPGNQRYGLVQSLCTDSWKSKISRVNMTEHGAASSDFNEAAGEIDFNGGRCANGKNGHKWRPAISE
ncbi:hypothetical protein LXL04_005199 [Taraxacum kok-saghyz]